MEETQKTENVQNTQKPPVQNDGSFMQLLCYVAAIAIVVMCFIGADQIAKASKDMISLRSVGGKTVAEAYYQDYGKFLDGLTYVVRAISIGFGALLICAGNKQRKNV